jgi:hypothetical protein
MRKSYFTKMSLRSLLYLPIIIGVLTILIIIPTYFNHTCGSYSCLSFPDKNIWKVKDIYEDNKYTWRGLLIHPNYLVRLYKQGNTTSDNADEFTKVTSMKINGLFDTAKSPYAGEISDKIVCPDNLKPLEEDIVSKTGTKIHFITSFLNDRMQYGACTENQIAYKVFSGMFFCPNVSEWYQIEIIVSIKNNTDLDIYKSLFLNVGCIN